MRLTIGKKLAWSFGVVLALMAVSSLTTYFMINQLTRKAIPLTSQCDELIINVERSLSALRGYVILGDSDFKSERTKAWTRIDEATESLTELRSTAMNRQAQSLWDQVASELGTMRIAQQQVENDAYSDDNIPAKKLLEEKASPAAKKMLASLTDMIDEESELEATPQRKLLLNDLANSRASLAMSLVLLRDFVLSGQGMLEAEFNSQWQRNEDALNDMESIEAVSNAQPANGVLHMFTKTQAAEWKQYIDTRQGTATGQSFLSIANEIIDLRKRDDWNKANFQLKTKALPAAKSIISSLDSLKDTADRTQRAASKAAVASLIAFTLVAVGFGCFVALRLSRSISARASILAERANHIAAGNLRDQSLETTSNDELGQLAVSFNQMTDNLRRQIKEMRAQEERLTAQNEILEEQTRTLASQEEMLEAQAERDKLFDAIRDAVGRLGEATRQILITTKQQAAGTQQQASAVSETAITVDEVSQTTEQAAERAETVAREARQAEAVGQEGQQAIADSVTAMSDVQSQVESIAENILALAEKAQAIGETIATVNDIAEQTNVLALNAAVEASRAGEHGKGFAVVAAEVKSLSGQAKKATSQISGILREIQKATNSAVLTTEQGTQSVSRASKIVQKAGETIATLAETIAQSVRSATQISGSASQQSAGIQQLNEGIHNIDRVTKQNVEAIRHIELSVQQLNALSSELASLTTQHSSRM